MRAARPDFRRLREAFLNQETETGNRRGGEQKGRMLAGDSSPRLESPGVESEINLRALATAGYRF